MIECITQGARWLAESRLEDFRAYRARSGRLTPSTAIVTDRVWFV